MTEGNQDWEKETLREIALFAHKEMREIRRWKIIGRFMKPTVVIALVALAYFMGAKGFHMGEGNPNKPHVAYVDVYGPIGAGELADADRLIPALNKAFKNKYSKAVALRINSGGGSPVQSGHVYQEIGVLKSKYPDKKVIAVIEDIGASGAYYIAAAADTILADRASMVGSIGVISSSFGYAGLMEKAGVERRVLTAGENKSLLDPYSPSNPEMVEYWKSMLGEIHLQFIGAVKDGRGDRLKEDDTLFTGLIWTGERALTMGLIDELGTMTGAAREILGEENLVDYTPRPDFIKQLSMQTQVAIRNVAIDLLSPTPRLQ